MATTSRHNIEYMEPADGDPKPVYNRSIDKIDARLPFPTGATYVQNYATATRTVDNYTPDVESVVYTGAADGEAKLTDLNALRVAYENLRADHENLKKVVTALIDDLQTAGIVA